MTPTTPASEQEKLKAELQSAYDLARTLYIHIRELYLPGISAGIEIIRFTNFVSHFEPLIAAALAQARDQAEREQMERDCKAVCEYCKSGHPYTSQFFHWVREYGEKSVTSYTVLCQAAPIRSANAERLRESEGETK